MQRLNCGPRSKPLTGSRRAFISPGSALLMIGVLLPAGLLTACGSGPSLVSSVSLPSDQISAFGDGTNGVDISAATDTAAKSAPLDLTDTQREYLQALAGAGVHPSSELRALSIGSYVCQAHAAGQSDDAVWDYVAPMVRSDVADSHVSSQSTPGLQADTAVTAYIRIATARLC